MRAIFSAAAAASSFGSAAAGITLLNNTRCHNDVAQFRNQTSWEQCSPLCLERAAAPAFSFCAPGKPADCPVPSPTCWCYLDTSDCEEAAGWVSGYVPAPPPISPPVDWADAIARGDTKFSGDRAELIGEGYFPVVANGFVGFEAGPFTQVFENAWPWRDAGSLKMSGVYNGRNFVTPSHRAQIPKITDMTIRTPADANVTALGCAIDFRSGAFYNRTLIGSGVAGCANGTVIEQRMYAHRALRELFVFDIRAFPASTGGDDDADVDDTDAASSWTGCTVPVEWRIAPNILELHDTALSQTLTADGQQVVWAGTTLIAEEDGLPLRQIAVVFDAWAAAGPASLAFSPATPQLSVRAVLRSDLDVAGAQTPQDVAAAAQSTWAAYASQEPAALFASHQAAMAELWASGVELAGNGSFAAALNASLYDIVSSLRADWNWTTSPGGLATGGYSGHAFWDMETWMFPVLTALFPDLARAAAQFVFVHSFVH
jgi:hypothetical protein